MVGTTRMNKEYIVSETIRDIGEILIVVIGGWLLFEIKSWIIANRKANELKRIASQELQAAVTSLVTENKGLRADMQGIKTEMRTSANSLNAKIDEKIGAVTEQLQEIHKELKTDILDIRQRVNLLEDIKRA